MTPTVVLSRSQVREVDRLAVEKYGIPSIVLMENAAKNLADFIRTRLAPGASVAIVCGTGNNGGDGYAAARQLAIHGVPVTLFEANEPARLRGDAATNREIVRRIGLPLRPFNTPQDIAAHKDELAGFSWVVDALLGTGFSGELRPPLELAARAINASRAVVVAADIPSGLDCDTGRPARDAVRARYTVTFVARKSGFDQPAAAEFLGEVHVADIGVPPRLIDEVRRGAPDSLK